MIRLYFLLLFFFLSCGSEFRFLKDSESRTEPPRLSEVTATLPGNLRLVFSKSLQTTGTQITSNYQINMSSPGNNIASAVLDTNSAIIYLTLSTPLNNGNYTMTVYNLADIDGNSIIENDIDNRSSFFITADNIPPVLNSAE